MPTIVLWTVTLFLISAGLIGTLVPAIPGVGLVFFGILFYALATSLQDISLTSLIWFAVFTALASIAQTAGSWFGAKVGGGGTLASWGTLVGALLGLFAGPMGIFVGAFAGALIGAFMEGHSKEKAVRVAFLSTLGVLGGTLIQILLALAMVVAFFALIAA